MNYKIVFFSENNFEGIVPRTHPNMRTDLAWMSSLKAQHFNLYNIPNELPQFDIGIVIYPKNIKQDINWNKFKNCKKIGIMQEGPNWHWESLSIENQLKYYTALNTVDFILCHNQLDTYYFKGLLKNSKPVEIMQTVLIEDLIKDVITNTKENKTIVGGNFTNWYGGFPSYIVASTFENDIYLPQMGRMKKEELYIDNINHIPYKNWFEWMKELSTFKYSVHLMKTFAAGTFALNCAFFGIPVIGYSYLDSQNVCHPLTTVTYGDIEMANSTAEQLKNDEEFYNECSITCKTNYLKYYSEKVFLEKMNKIFKNILK